jgi:hypothetical protein
MSDTGKVRSERWRQRRRSGSIAVTVAVSPAQRRAFERMGLIEPGCDQDQDELRWAVERYLDTAPAVQGIGDALYKGADAFSEPGDESAEGATASPVKRQQNEE